MHECQYFPRIRLRALQITTKYTRLALKYSFKKIHYYNSPRDHMSYDQRLFQVPVPIRALLLPSPFFSLG